MNLLNILKKKIYNLKCIMIQNIFTNKQTEKAKEFINYHFLLIINSKIKINLNKKIILNINK